jgi:hypothetical protein
MNFKEIVSKLEELDVTPELLAHFDDQWYWYDDDVPDHLYDSTREAGLKRREKFFDTFGRVVEVEQKGGQGEGEEWYSVIHFEDHDVYIRIDGYYSSYGGTDFDSAEFNEVRPKEKTITVYE